MHLKHYKQLNSQYRSLFMCVYQALLCVYYLHISSVFFSSTPACAQLQAAPRPLPAFGKWFLVGGPPGHHRKAIEGSRGCPQKTSIVFFVYIFCLLPTLPLFLHFVTAIN